VRNLLSDIGKALVAIRRRPGAVVVPVLTMAIGIGASTAIFSALYVALFHALPYPEPDRLVVGRATFSGEINPWASAPDFYDYRDRNSLLSSLSAYSPGSRRTTVSGAGGGESVLVELASWNLFRTLGVSPVLGRGFTPDEGEKGGLAVAVVSYGYWQRSLGGTRDAVGQTLALGATKPVIVGVMPRGFRFAVDADVWIPMQRNAQGNAVRHFHNWMLLGRLKPGVRLTQAQQQIDRISLQLQHEYPDSNKNKALLLTPLQEVLSEDDRPSLFVLMAAVGVLLLVACADVAGLLLSRGATRRTEIAVRSALGATRGDLVRQLLAESLVVAIAAGGLGLVVAIWLRSAVLRFVPLEGLGVTQLPLGGPVLLFALGTVVMTSALFGVVPALLGARGWAAGDLKSGSRTTETRSRAFFRQGLVATQVAMSVVLLVAAALLGRSLLRLASVDPGFDTANLLTAQLPLSGDAYQDPAARVRFFQALLDDARAIPGVTAATLISGLPILDPAGNVPAWDAAHPPAQTSEAPVVCARMVLPGYFKTMGIPIVAGRDVSAGDVAGSDRPPVVVISRSVGSTLFPGVNPIGRRLGIFTGSQPSIVAEVVGIAGDVRMNSLANEYSLAMYLPYQVRPQPVMRIAVRTAGDSGAVGAALRRAVVRRDRGLLLVDVKTMDAVLSTSLEGFSLRAGALFLFGATALLLAMLGVYGVLALTVNQRRPEIGLRMVMGASRPDMLRWVLSRGLRPVAVGLLIGLAAALGVGRLLGDLLFNVEPTDAVTFGAVTLCLILAALASCLVPAWRALNVDPVVALRQE
jgi:putative ABC transport system permease protein